MGVRARRRAADRAARAGRARCARAEACAARPGCWWRPRRPACRCRDCATTGRITSGRSSSPRPWRARRSPQDPARRGVGACAPEAGGPVRRGAGRDPSHPDRRRPRARASRPGRRSFATPSMCSGASSGVRARLPMARTESSAVGARGGGARRLPPRQLHRRSRRTEGGARLGARTSAIPWKTSAGCA